LQSGRQALFVRPHKLAVEARPDERSRRVADADDVGARFHRSGETAQVIYGAPPDLHERVAEVLDSLPDWRAHQDRPRRANRTVAGCGPTAKPSASYVVIAAAVKGGLGFRAPALSLPMHDDTEACDHD